MSTNAAPYVGDKLLNWIKGTAFGSAPATVYCSLWNGDPDAGGTEVTGTVSLTRQGITWSAVATRAMNNSADIAFGTASGSATVTYIAIFDSATPGAGNQIAKLSIASSAIANGNAVKITATNLALSY